MQFKPLISDDEFRRAEADIEAAAEMERLAAQAKPDPAMAEPDVQADIHPDVRLETFHVSSLSKIRAIFGFSAAKNRVETVNRIVNTLRLGLDNGLYDGDKPGGGKGYSMALKLHAMAIDPATPNGEIPVILGWLQAIVAMTCDGLTPRDVRRI